MIIGIICLDVIEINCEQSYLVDGMLPGALLIVTTDALNSWLFVMYYDLSKAFSINLYVKNFCFP